MGWNNASVLEVKLRDESNKLIYKSKANVNDIKRLSLIMESLKSLGVRIIEAIGRMIDSEDREEGWFN